MSIVNPTECDLSLDVGWAIDELCAVRPPMLSPLECSKLLPSGLPPGSDVRIRVVAKVYDHGDVPLLDVTLKTPDAPTEPGSKSGQHRAVDVPFDGGKIQTSFVWHTKDRLWVQQSQTSVTYSVKRAKAAAAKKVAGFIADVLRAHEAPPRDDDAHAASWAAARGAEAVARLDGEISAAEAEMVALRAKRERAVAAAAEFAATRIEVDAEMVAKRARKDAVVSAWAP